MSVIVGGKHLEAKEADWAIGYALAKVHRQCTVLPLNVEKGGDGHAGVPMLDVLSYAHPNLRRPLVMSLS